MTIASTGYARDGYIFMGWNTSAGGTGTWYITSEDAEAAQEAGATVSEDSLASFTMPAANVTLYAQWVAVTETEEEHEEETTEEETEVPSTGDSTSPVAGVVAIAGAVVLAAGLTLRKRYQP